MELAKAYVQIVPTTKGIAGSISSALGGESAKAGTSAGDSFGANLVGTLKKIIIAAGIGKFIGDALSAGGDLQQSFGGLETIYGEEAADAMKKYAYAAQEAGISANNYAEQAVSFGASLKQAFGGDTVAAAEAANVAIMDMADNSAKMGTDIQSIQNAYQGFAKQNYTMLDNLKLGYGGTKSEMERLLADAQELSGVEYNIDNLGDVYAAIHVIQEDLGLTGVAADEAKGTFTGSFSAMQAAAENFMAALTTGGDVEGALKTLVGSAGDFLMNNAIPMIMNLVSSIPDILTSTISTLVPMLPGFVSQILDVISSSFSALTAGGAQMAETVWNLINQLITFIQTNLPTVLQAGMSILNSIVQGIVSKLPEIANSAISIINSLLSTIMESLPSFMDQGFEMILNLVNGILESLPSIITTAGDMVNTFLDGILTMLPMIWEKGSDMLLQLVDGIVSNLPQIIQSATQVFSQFLQTITSHLPDILQKGIEIIAKLISGLIQSIPDIIAAIPQIVSAIIDSFGSVDWKTVGTDILAGIAQGIVNGVDSIKQAALDAANAALDAAKEALGIASPSKVMRDEVGKWIPAGIAVGIDNNAYKITEAMDDLVEETTGQLKTDLVVATSKNSYGTGFDSDDNYAMNGGYVQNVYITSPTALSPSEIARQTRNANRQMVLALRGV